MFKKAMFYLLLIGIFSSCNQNENPNLSPLQKLEQGNERFSSGQPMHPNETLKRIRELKKGQHPFAVIVSCSDSRVPTELVFDQGLGDIFSIRVAGNVIGAYELGSLEYAVEHLDCKLIVVLGHKDCGAIKAFMDSKGNYTQADHIKSIVNYIENESEEIELQTKNQFTYEKAIDANIAHGVAFLKTAEPILKEKFDQNKITIIGALYDIETGKVTFKK